MIKNISFFGDELQVSVVGHRVVEKFPATCGDSFEVLEDKQGTCLEGETTLFLEMTFRSSLSEKLAGEREIETTHLCVTGIKHEKNGTILSLLAECIRSGLRAHVPARFHSDCANF